MCSEAEDAGGLTPGKDDNEAARYFLRRTLLILRCVDYISSSSKLRIYTSQKPRISRSSRAK